MKKRHVLRIAVAVLIATFTPTVRGDTLSESFSVGYGFSPPGGWSTNETANANTPATAPIPNGGTFAVGDFLFSVAVANSMNSSAGPVFTNRVLSAGDGGQNTAQSQLTTVSITATYTGPTPPSDATNVGFELVIDQISIWAHKHPVQEGTTNEIWWIETTTGNSNNSESVYAPEGASIDQATDYVKLTWNPSDFVVTNGTNSTRTFVFPTDRNFLVDGLEIVGSGKFSHTTPERNGLFILGGLLLMICWNRMRAEN